MPLDTTNFHPQGPVKSVDMLQFTNLLTGVMTDQPVTLSNSVTIGGNQGLTTVPLRVYGAVGQNTNLIDLYADKNQAQPGFGFSALGRFAWGPGGASPQDTFLSRIGTQNGHSSDTPGLLVNPSLEIVNDFTVGRDLTVTRYLNILGGTGTKRIYVAQGSGNQPLQVTDSSNNLLMGGVYGTYIDANAYWSNTGSWATYDTTAGSTYFAVTNTGGIIMSTASATTGTPTLNTKFQVDLNGYLTAQAGALFNGDISTRRNAGNVAGVVNFGVNNGYIIFDGNNWSCQPGDWYQAQGIHSAGNMYAGGNMYVTGGYIFLSAQSDAVIAKWNANQTRIMGAGGGPGSLSVNGIIHVESDYSLSFDVNGYGWKGVSGQAQVRTEASVIAAAGAIYLDGNASASVRFYWDGTWLVGGTHFRAIQSIRADNGSYYAGASSQSLIQMWNPGEWRISSSPGNLYAVGIIAADGAYVACNGGPCRGNGAYVNTASSETVKKNIVSLDPEACLDQVLDPRARPVSFEYIRERDFGPVAEPTLTREQVATPANWSPQLLGFIAEEVATVVPQAVGLTDDGLAAGLTPEALIPVLWGAVRALSAKVDQLERAA